MTDHQTVTLGLDDLSRGSFDSVYVEYAFDLGEDSGQEAEVAAAHPNEARYHFRNELLVREDNAGRRPSFFKQFLDLRCIERTELMDEPDARVELRKTSDPFLYTRHERYLT